MPPDNPTTEPATNSVGIDASPRAAAPAREKRLVPVAPPRPRERPVTTVPVPTGRPSNRPPQAPGFESKVAAIQDPDEMLTLIRTEAALRRAQRLSGAGAAHRQTMRLLSIGMLFALLAAAIGAMWYLQTSLQASHRARRAPAATSADGQVLSEPPGSARH